MRYVHSLDPECPVVAEFMETLFGDPTMAMGAPVEDITEEFERRHRRQCKRCQEYGVRQRVTERRLLISGSFTRSSAAVATSREGHRSLTTSG
jgi:hypothetical protein